MTIFRKVHIGSIDYVSGQKKTLTIPTDGVVVQYVVRLAFTVTNGGSAAVGPLFQTLARIIRRLDITYQGRDTVVSQSGEMLAARAQYEQGVPCYGMDDSVVLTGSAATTYNVAIPIMRFLPRSTNPFRTSDDLRRISQAVMEITWGDSACAFFYGTPNSAALSAVTCRVEAWYLLDVMPEARFDVRELSEINQSYSATNTALGVTLDSNTGVLFRSLAVASLVASVGSNSPLNAGKVTVKAASFTFQECDGRTIQANNRHDFEQASLITGFYFLPLTFAGDPSMMINTLRPNLTGELQALFDVTYTSGTHELLIGKEIVRPPKFQ